VLTMNHSRQCKVEDDLASASLSPGTLNLEVMHQIPLTSTEVVLALRLHVLATCFVVSTPYVGM